LPSYSTSNLTRSAALTRTSTRPSGERRLWLDCASARDAAHADNAAVRTRHDRDLMRHPSFVFVFVYT
jgi:hypothetical protein